MNTVYDKSQCNEELNQKALQITKYEDVNFLYVKLLIIICLIYNYNFIIQSCWLLPGWNDNCSYFTPEVYLPVHWAQQKTPGAINKDLRYY